jgi:hypothetical protein
MIGCFKRPDFVHLLNNCNGELKILNISSDELFAIERISTDRNFIQAMIDLKEKDPIEYQLKMSQFKTQVQQQKQMSRSDSNAIKCPTCSSRNVKRISGMSKAAGAAMFGLFSKTAKSQFECENCGYKW